MNKNAMDRLLDVMYGAALILIFGGALLADGLADIPHGFAILFGIVGAGAALAWMGASLEARR